MRRRGIGVVELPRRQQRRDGGERDDVSQNRALLWGIFGIVTGVIVAAGFMFRGFEKKYIDEVPPPFIEEE